MAGKGLGHCRQQPGAVGREHADSEKKVLKGEKEWVVLETSLNSFLTLPTGCPGQRRLVNENILPIPFSYLVLNDDKIVDMMYLQHITTNGPN